MSPLLLTTYLLVWPVIAAGVFVTLLVTLIIDMKAAKKAGKSMV